MKGFRSAVSLGLIILLSLGMVLGSFADSAPKWYLDKDYEEGDYVKFRGSIYIATQDHESSQENYPGNDAFWVEYKKGAGFKKGNEPKLDENYKKDEEKDKDEDDKKVIESVYEEDQVKVYFNVKSVDEDGYKALITLYNSKDRDVADWSLSFEFDDDEVLVNAEDVTFDQDGDDVVIDPENDDEEIQSKKKFSFEIEVEADIDLESDEDDDEDEDNDDEKDLNKIINMPSDFDLDITFAEVETGAVVVQLEEPDFDEDLFDVEVKIGNETMEVEWDGEVIFTDLVAGKEYTVFANTFEEDGTLYKPVIENKKVKVGSDELEIVTISYEEEEVSEETGRVLVYVFKPSFDEDLFTPEVTIDGESKDVEWGEYVYFEDLTAGEEYEIEVDSVEIDDDTYKPVLSADEIKVKEEKVAYVIVKYVKK